MYSIRSITAALMICVGLMASPVFAQLDITDAEMRAVVDACKVAIEEDAGGPIRFPIYSEDALDAAIGFVGLRGSGEELRYMLRNAPKVDQSKDALEKLKRAREYGIGPEMMLEFAIEETIQDRTIYKGYMCHTKGAEMRGVSESYSFEF